MCISNSVCVCGCICCCACFCTCTFFRFSAGFSSILKTIFHLYIERQKGRISKHKKLFSEKTKNATEFPSIFQSIFHTYIRSKGKTPKKRPLQKNKNLSGGGKIIMKRTEVKIYRYELSKGFRAEIEFRENDKAYGKIYKCYLYHTDYGIKESIFGLPEFQECENKHYSLEEIEEILETNLYGQNYFETYYEEFMMYDEEIEEWLEAINEWRDDIESEE